MSSSGVLKDRLDFMQLNDKEQGAIRSVKTILMSELPGALDKFYTQVQLFPEPRKFFTGTGQMDGAKTRQLQHWNFISDARFDDGYVKAVTTVGEVHARIGLEPRWYIGGYAMVLDTLIGKILAARWPRRRFGGKPAEVEQFRSTSRRPKRPASKARPRSCRRNAAPLRVRWAKASRPWPVAT